ncbi:MAG TPA: TolC family protein [Candidatus Melainabacteria bacterium]|nr:TolC family protein [Candidatus Melainabacteria bacterium]HIN65484.1 TolC family protein [Candidatus Obscuribacterales bacterium]
MLRKSKLAITALNAVPIMTASCLVFGTPAVGASVDAGKDNRDALTDLKKPLKTVLPNAEQKHPPKYVIELKATQTVRPLGKGTVDKVETPLERIKPDGAAQESDETGVLIEHPSLEALIPLEENLNPFSLDARYIEKVSLKDTLEAALAQNLDIEEGFVRSKIERYSYLSSATGFLPNLNGGYNLFGINGSIPSTLFGSTPATNAGNRIDGGRAKLPSSIQLLQAGFTYNLYKGGSVVFGTLQQRHRWFASRAGLTANVNDTLLNATKKHYDLLLQEALLAIRTRAVAISVEQVRLNQAQERAGTATGLDVLQSQAQLASDEQNLVEQQNQRRQSAIQLAHVLNASFSQDLESCEKYLKKKRLIPKSIPIEKLLVKAIDSRPELKQYEELRLAAKRAIVVAAAPMQPNVSFGGSIVGVGTGGNLDPIYNINLGIKWGLGGMGTKDLLNMQRARWEARQAAVQAKKTFLNVFDEVRTSYNNSAASDKKIDRATVQVLAAEEELRIAKKRMSAGIGLNIDVLNAQRDLTQASVNKARAVVDFNVAQAQLLRDIGSVSVASLTEGLKL